MPFIKPLTRDAAPPEVQAQLDGVQRALGRVPNVFGVLAHSPVALGAYFALAEQARKSRLGPLQREGIALAVSQKNECHYCIAAHAASAKAGGMAASEIQAARSGRSEHTPDDLMRRLAVRIVETRGEVPESELESFRARGMQDAVLLEVLVQVVLSIYTNYVNRLARTEVDFPAVSDQPEPAGWTV